MKNAACCTKVLCHVVLATAGICLLLNGPVFSSTYNAFEIATKETADDNLTPYGMNDSGHVIAYSSCYTNAVVFDGSTFTQIPRVSMLYSVVPSDINNQGYVTGYGKNSGNKQRSFIWDGSGTSLQALDTMGGDRSIGYGINESVQLAGHTRDEDGNDIGFFYDGSTMTDIGSLGGDTVAYDINDSAHITGYSENASGEVHAFFYNGSEITDLGTLGGSRSYAYALNNLDHVVGYSKDSDGLYPAFIWDAVNGMSDLGELTEGGASQALDINDSDQVVGKAINGDGDYVAFLWKNGTMYDLNALVVYDMVLTEAVSINSKGWILCRAELTDMPVRTVILKPSESGTGVIYGCVTSDILGYNSPLEGATVSIESLSLSAQTDESGNFRLINVPSGNYSITVQMDAFQDKILSDISLPDNEDTEILAENLIMESETVSIADANKNSKVDLADAIHILRQLAGL